MTPEKQQQEPECTSADVARVARVREQIEKMGRAGGAGYRLSAPLRSGIEQVSRSASATVAAIRRGLLRDETRPSPKERQGSPDTVGLFLVLVVAVPQPTTRG